MGVFDRQPLDEFYLENIAKLDKRIAKEKERIIKYGNNRITVAAFKNNIKLFEGQRSNLQKELLKYRKEKELNDTTQKESTKE